VTFFLLLPGISLRAYFKLAEAVSGINPSAAIITMARLK